MEDNDIIEKDPKWDQDSELRSIKKSIRRRNWRLVSVSVILAAALLLGSIYGIIPQVERLYWNPDEAAYPEGTDLEITLNAYTELFNPGYRTSWVTYQRTGFASYDLEILLRTTATGEMLSVGGSLEYNELRVDEMFRFPEGKDYPLHRDASRNVPVSPYDTEVLRETLSALPEYVRLEATITFGADLSMEELVQFNQERAMDPSLDAIEITWVAVRTGECDDGWAPVCGMSLGGGRSYPLVDLDYCCFNGPAKMNRESLEHHFKSLLQYSADQVEKGKGIVPYEKESLYTEILDYVEENGIKTYGVVLNTTPRTLLELMDNELVYDITLVDGWIDIG